MVHPIIIIGSGLAAYAVARDFRKLNTTTPLLMITADGGDYYSKPMLSSAFTKQKTPELLVIQTAAAMSEQLSIEIMPHTRVLHIDPTQHQVCTDRGNFTYDRLVMATGANVAPLSLQGNAANEVLTVNNLDDYKIFRSAIVGAKRLLIIGAGLIGCEFSNDLLRAGFEIHVVDPLGSPLQQLLPEVIGLHLKKALESQGVQWHLGKTVKAVNRAGEGFSVELSDASRLSAEVVLSVVGLRLDKTLTDSAGLLVNRGIVVNRYLETNQPAIYALGDCAEVEGYALRYTSPLFECAKTLAKTLAGERSSVHYPAMPVVVKTPDYPVVVLPAPVGVEGSWEFQDQETGEVALFHDQAGDLRGFVLTRGAISQRAMFVARVGDWV